MGVAQNALLGAGSAIGVAASKFATNLKSAISEANDAKKSKMAAQRAKQNKEEAIKQKKVQKQKTRDTLKKLEGVSKGVNKDVKTNVLSNELLRDR